MIYLILMKTKQNPGNHDNVRKISANLICVNARIEMIRFKLHRENWQSIENQCSFKTETYS